MKDNKRLKELSDNYEVDFDSVAWDKMEKLLPEASSPRVPFFKRFRFIAAVVLLLVGFVGGLFFLSKEEGSGIVVNDTDVIDSQVIMEDVVGVENTSERLPVPLKGETRRVPNENTVNNFDTKQNTNNSQTNQTNQTNTQPKTQNLTTPNSPTQNPKNPFFQKIAETLKTWSTQSNPEKTYLHTDRAFYKPGESIWFAAYVRNADDLRASRKSDMVYVEWIAPNGKTEKKLTLIAQNGVVAGDILTTKEMVGGTYKLKAYTNWQKNTETYFEKEIQIQKTVLPRLRMELDFERKAYGAGDEVIAKLDLNTLENAPLKEYEFSYVFNLNGEQISELNGKTDAAGHAELKLQLPTTLDTNDGLINILIDYNGQTESISRAVPIILNKIDLQFFPEGGQNIANVKSRIAFKAVNEFGKPADIEGLVTNELGEVVTTFKSYHQGMGAFNWTPQTNETYTAKITKPAGIQQIFTLPKTEKRGYSLSIKEVTKDAIIAEINTTENEELHLIAQARDQAVFHKSTPEKSGTHTVTIPTKNLPIGITQLTLFDSQEIARAERLVFVNADKKLNITVRTDKEKYQPREKVKMTVDVRDERGIPMSGTFSVAVADDNLLTYADDKQGHILSQILLQSDLKGEINEPNFYFDAPKPGETKDRVLALDYLLMTQGWRRYEWLDAGGLPVVEEKFKAEKAVIAGRVFDRDKEPMENAIVSLDVNGKKAKTDSTGYFKFENVPYSEKGYALSVKKQYEIIQKVAMYSEDLIVDMFEQNAGQVAIISRKKGNKTVVQGRVFEKATGEGLIGLSIHPVGETWGTVTDIDGNFSIELRKGTHNLEFNYTGYSSQNLVINIEENEEVTVELGMFEPEYALDEVVVVGYGVTVKKQNLSSAVQSIKSKNTKRKKKREENRKSKFEINEGDTEDEIVRKIESGSVSTALIAQEVTDLPTRNVNGIAAQVSGVSTIDEDKIEDMEMKRKNDILYYVDGVMVQGSLMPKTENENVQDMLAGKIAGVNLDKRENNIRLRGVGSINSENEPLFVVDGIAMPALKDRNVDFLDADNIEKIEVLKGESATAIYGNIAKNGVVIIKTKTGKGLTETEKRSLLQKQIYSFENFIEELEERVALGENIASDNSSFSQMHGELYRLSRQYKGDDAKVFQKEISQLNVLGKDLIESQKYAQTFKTGYYRARKFYTPKYNSFREVETRTDFRPTIYWNPTLEVKNDGKAEVEFYNSDEITTFKAIVEGIAIDGSIGRGEATFYSILPFGMTTKVPTNVLAGDEFMLPLTLMNTTSETLTGFFTVLAPSGFEITQKIPSVVTLQAGEKKTISLPYKVNNFAKNGTFKILFETDNLKDAFEQDITVLQRGFPINEVVSAKAQRNKFNININELVDKSLTAKLTVYPNLEEDIITTTERMLRQPSGCFEQTSSSNYPNLLVLDFLKSTGRLRPNVESKAKAYLDKGYKRLIGFEVEGGGFDWFGKPPAHEALTAYGLMQFVDMKSVYPVDNQLISRTADWLLSRRDGKGSWQNATRGRHSWALQTPVGDAYIVWAMSEAGYGNEISLELEKSYQDAIKTQDPYIMALVVLALQNVEDKRANGLLAALSNLENKDGFWNGLTHSMTHSKGKGLAIETTALTALAMLRTTDEYNSEIERAMAYIHSSKNEYGFGSTQSTVLALKALTEYAKKSPIADETGGEVTLLIDGKKIKKQSYLHGSKSAIIFDDLAGYFTEGNHVVDVKFSTEEAILPFDFSVKYATTLPPSSPKCAMELSTELNTEEVNVGETVRYVTEIQNVTSEDIANPIAVIGIPAGLSLQPWQLKKLEEQGLCDYYELKGNYLVLYYRGLTAGEKRTINLDLKADIAGSFEAPASVAYLYYENEHRNWASSTEIRVNP